MEVFLQYTEEKKWLRLPFEYLADKIGVTVTDEKGRVQTLSVRLSVSRIDLWMCYPLTAFVPGTIRLSTEKEAWLGAACVTAHPEEQKRRELSRPVVHYMPPTGGIGRIRDVYSDEEEWRMVYDAVPLSLSNSGSSVVRAVRSRDFLHWSEDAEDIPEIPGVRLQKASCWLGDVEEQYQVSQKGEVCLFAKSTGQRIEALAGACVLSLPAEVKDKKVSPKECVKNLRVWERSWKNEALDGSFDFSMRFRLEPDVWPEIKLKEASGTVDDIRTKACEVKIELFVGQEREIVFDLCHVKWTWRALDQTISCKQVRLQVPVRDGRIRLHFFSDLVVQELFADTDHAVLILKEDGPQKYDYQIKSDLVENINNSSFYIQYNGDPYLRIQTPGSTASIVSLKIWGLRPTRYGAENRRLLEQVKKGRPLYACAHYTVFENCVEDRIYGDPAAWVLNEGRTVLSPVRAVEEFCWRDTPWGDMTRMVNRTERWDAQEEHVYPKLITRYPVLNAAFRLSTEILKENREERYALPGQEGLINAALFQGVGEGFGSWVRDTCHAAFRAQNLLAPGEARESLSYISEHGFCNGEDCAAMPAIAAWDYYVATGEVQLLYEMLPGILKYAREAEERYDSRMNLVHANMCLAQDAFEEPENGGYCLGTEIAFALMYEAAANICRVTKQNEKDRDLFKRRAKEMTASIREKFWNEEKGCFTSGPRGSEAYEKGMWEATGAEMALWPRFGIATREQRIRFLEVIKRTPDACSDFGINWYPFRKEKNHFWRACWVSWTLGIAVASGELGDREFLRDLIFQQVRNVILNKSFHEVMDYDTGRAWRWPHLPWHAAGFIGFLVNGVFGISYGEEGLKLRPCVPAEFDGAVLRGLSYRKAQFLLKIEGHGTDCTVFLDGKPVEGAFGKELSGFHEIVILAK